MKRIFYILPFLFILGSCKKVWHKASSDRVTYKIESTSDLSEEDNSLALLIQPYKSQLDEEMNVVIGECMQEMPKERPESLLGNWMADAIHARAEKETDLPIAFGVQNFGGIRIPGLNKGPITKGKVFELMPFDNSIVILKIKGSVVKEYLLHSNGWPISYSVRAEITGEQVEASIHGEKLEMDKVYNVAVPDYIANGGSNCAFFKGTDRVVLPILIRDALIDYVTETVDLDSKIEGRMVINKN